jgi:5-methyltetrahydropteroyltriglutamate--homocysteine methyltransferase
VTGIQTTVVGSYPVPEWLRAYPTDPHLADATLVVVRTQELAGIDVVTDGELSRFDVDHPQTNGMIDYFVSRLAGVGTRLTRGDQQAFTAQEGMGYRAQAAGVVVAPIGVGYLDLPAPAAALRSLTERRTKFTVTSPYMLAKVLLDRCYGDREELCLAIADALAEQLAEIDADVVQIDEANVTGHPEDGALASAAINRALAGVRSERAVHLCFGNYGGQTVQTGAYEKLLPFMNALQVDHLVLEFARRGYEELPTLRELDPKIGVGLGVVDIKDNGVETPDEIARRIDHAASILGPERVRYVHPDCGFWMLTRPIADAKMRSLAAGRDLASGR